MWQCSVKSVHSEDTRYDYFQIQYTHAHSEKIGVVRKHISVPYQKPKTILAPMWGRGRETKNKTRLVLPSYIDSKTE